MLFESSSSSGSEFGRRGCGWGGGWGGGEDRVEVDQLSGCRGGWEERRVVEGVEKRVGLEGQGRGEGGGGRSEEVAEVGEDTGRGREGVGCGGWGSRGLGLGLGWRGGDAVASVVGEVRGCGRGEGGGEGGEEGAEEGEVGFAEDVEFAVFVVEVEGQEEFGSVGRWCGW